MKLQFRLIALLLSFVMTVSLLTGFVPASAADEPAQTTVNSANVDDQMMAAETDLNTIVTDNGDGTHTMQIFSHPVKYVDAAGLVQDISLDVTQSANGSYVPASHSIQMTFPRSLSDGITMEYEDVDIQLLPDFSGTTAPTARLDSTGKAVMYPVDSKTALVYQLTYAGFKEDILVKSYTGQTEYTFTLLTGGLTLQKEEESYYLVNGDGEIKANIGDIIVFTADEKNNTFGTMTYETVRANQEYELTIHLDGAYLASADTAYPIRIDPTIEINYDNDGAGAIEDVTINSLRGSDGSAQTLRVGLRETYGISRLLMKLPGLDLSDLPSAAGIVSAEVQIRDLMCEAEVQVIECHVFTGNTWTESTASWTSVGADSIGTLLDSVSLSYDIGAELEQWQRYSFDVTEAVKGWVSGSYDENKGLIFKATNAVETGSSYQHRSLASYNRTTNQPSFSVTFDASIVVSESTIALNENSTYSLTATTNPGGQTVTWSSSNTTRATVSANGLVTGKKAGRVTITASYVDEDGIAHSDSCNVYVKIPDGIYYLGNSGRYLALEDGTGLAGSDVLLLPQETADPERVLQLWHIYYLGSGMSVIRPVIRNNMGLSYPGNKVMLQSASYVNTLSYVPANSRWNIAYGSGGYNIWKGEEGATALYSASLYNSGSNVVGCGSYTGAAASYYRWTFVSPSTSVPNQMALYDLETDEFIASSGTAEIPELAIVVGETKTLLELNCALVVCPGLVQNVSAWTSSNPSVATVNSTTGAVTAVGDGLTLITASQTLSGTRYSVSYYLRVIPLHDGTYYWKNRETSRYLDVEDPSLGNNTGIIQYQFYSPDTQAWTLTYIGGGYYSIKLNSQATGYYLGVKNDSTALNAEIVLRTGTITDGMKWKLSKTSSGSYIVTPKTGERTSGGNYVLTTASSERVDGVGIIQSSYVNNANYQDEWTIIPSSTTILLEPQQKESWCWAACARMASMRYMVSPISQASLAVYIKLGIETEEPTESQMNLADFTAEADEIERAVEYLLGSENVYSAMGKRYSAATLRSILDSGNPVIALRKSYMYHDWVTSVSGHAIIIYDYYWSDDDGMYYYCVHDPLPVNAGTSNARTYEAICSNTGWDTEWNCEKEWLWEGVVVFEEGNYMDLIDAPQNLQNCAILETGGDVE